MVKLSHWISAARLRTLPLALSSILMGGALGVLRGGFDYEILLWTGVTTVLLQILSNYSNDFGDTLHGADNAERIGPARAVQSGAISQHQMKKAIMMLSVVAFISGIYTLYLSGIRMDQKGLFYLMLGIAAIAAAINYTAGKNPYGYKGMGDLFVFLFFGIVGVLGSSSLHDLKPPLWSEVLPAISIGLLCAGVLNLNNMRDRVPDERAGKDTMAVKLGPVTSKRYHYLIVSLGLVSMLAFGYIAGLNGFQWLFLITYPVFIFHMLRVSKTQSDEQLDPELKKLALSTFILALIFLITLFF